MENLGKYLRELRESKELDPDIVYLDIRIRPEQIKLIEENRLIELGHLGIARAIVYNYAKYLDADLEAVKAELNVLLPDAIGKKRTPPQNVKHSKIMLSTNFLWSVGIVIFALILASFVYYAYTRDWLKTPELFKSEAADTTVAVGDIPVEEVKTDSLRLKMRMLSKSITSETAVKQEDRAKSAPRDTTDFLGKLLGDSPINVPTR